MFKIGDRVRLTDKCLYLLPPYSCKVGDIGYIEADNRQDSLIVKMENPKNGLTYLWCYASELEHAEKTPPEKITQNGYEYSLVGPVKPEWLVDGVWVVNVCDGGKRLVKEERPGVFNLKVNDLVSIRYHDGIRNQYRPHKPKDWKWGDWAMYRGKRVFVMSSIAHDNLVGISFPNIDGKDLTDPSDQWDFAEESGLTPTF